MHIFLYGFWEKLTPFSFLEYFDAFEIEVNVVNFVYYGKTRCINLLNYLPVCLSAYLSDCLSTCLPSYLSVYLPTSLSTCLSIYLPIHLLTYILT